MQHKYINNYHKYISGRFTIILMDQLVSGSMLFNLGNPIFKSEKLNRQGQEKY